MSRIKSYHRIPERPHLARHGLDVSASCRQTTPAVHGFRQDDRLHGRQHIAKGIEPIQPAEPDGAHYEPIGHRHSVSNRLRLSWRVMVLEFREAPQLRRIRRCQAFRVETQKGPFYKAGRTRDRSQALNPGRRVGAVGKAFSVGHHVGQDIGNRLLIASIAEMPFGYEHGQALHLVGGIWPRETLQVDLDLPHHLPKHFGGPVTSSVEPVGFGSRNGQAWMIRFCCFLISV
jgi:hypothetical protein